METEEVHHVHVPPSEAELEQLELDVSLAKEY